MTRHRIVNPDGLPEPRGFSHAVVASSGRDTVYLAGQIGAGETLAEQFDDACANLLMALAAAGGKPDDLVSLQIFVTDVEEYRMSLAGLSVAWRKHFERHYPAMGLFGVTGLAVPEARVELMGIAVLGG
jgi:enamine deaminase RidA (YjgF/YER057c/UK114 family)